MRMHVNNVGSDSDVYRHRHVSLHRGAKHAVLAVRAMNLVDVLAERLAESLLVDRAALRGDREGIGRLAGHAEVPARQLGHDVLAGLADESEFEVVNRCRTVHRDGLDQAALDPVDEIRPAPGLDDMPAQGGDYRLALGVSSSEVIANAAEIVGGELPREGLDPVVG